MILFSQLEQVGTLNKFAALDEQYTNALKSCWNLCVDKYMDYDFSEENELPDGPLKNVSYAIYTV